MIAYVLAVMLSVELVLNCLHIPDSILVVLVIVRPVAVALNCLHIPDSMLFEAMADTSEVVVDTSEVVVDTSEVVVDMSEVVVDMIGQQHKKMTLVSIEKLRIIYLSYSRRPLI